MKYNEFSKEVEVKIQRFWKEERIVEKLRERDAEGEKFYFLEGPPYTSGKIHLGHAWNMALKDMVLRYKRMQGKNVWDRMGYDMHGLPTEQKTMKRLGLKNKAEIEKFGLFKFRQECEKFCLEMKEGMDKDFQRLAVTLDYTDSYQPIKSEFIEGVWWLVKQAHKKGRLYQGLRTMHWDYATQSAVAKHELEYKSVKDTSIYVKFERENSSDLKSSGIKSYFVIWTTTPWTIPLNLAIMVNPELDYVEVEVEDDSLKSSDSSGENSGKERWVVAKNLHEEVLEKAKIKSFKIVNTFKGSKIGGEKYNHPLGVLKLFPEELQENEKLFTVLLTKEHCDDSSGTGLVHCAPGCGPEDYEVGYKNGLTPFNPVNEAGLFENFAEMTNFRAKLDDDKFIELIDSKGALVAKKGYTHDYPHGERSHEPVIFRTTKQWFFKIEDLKEKLLGWNEKVNWYPESGKNAFRNWLENLRDNSISKQRFWGSPVPIWMHVDLESGEEDYIVVGSVAELEELSGQKVNDLHLPKIDEIIILKDGKEYKRVPDVLDVWIDAGTGIWNCLDYPRRTDLLKKYFPADFILEGKDQIRGWFNLLMVASALGLDEMPFKSVYMHGFVTDVDGEKMSKSLGNIISPYEVIEKHSVDVLRSYMCRATAGEDANFSWDELVVIDRRLKIWWNLQKFILNLSIEIGQNPFELDSKIVKESFDVEEKYIFSRLQSVLGEVSCLMEGYKLDKVPSLIDNLFLELSRDYVKKVRDKAAVGTEEEKEAVLYTASHVFLTGLKMASILVPFISEAIYQNLAGAFELEEESISHYMWPSVDESMLDLELEEQMGIIADVLQAGLNAREKAKLGLRWPVKEMVIVSTNEKVVSAVKRLDNLLKVQLNVKFISVMEKFAGLSENVKPNLKKIGPKFARNSAKVIAAIEGFDNAKILAGINSEGCFKFKLESGEDIEILEEDLILEREVPKGYEEGDFKLGYLYLNLERNMELDCEGYARELMRNVQSSRKKKGLVKGDKIDLHLKVETDLVAALNNFKNDIAEKVGAKLVEVSDTASTKNYTNGSNVKIKDKNFVISFSKLA